MTEDYKDLFNLKDLPEYKVAEDYPDVTGWDVIDTQGQRIGDVSNLLVSKREERVVYLDVEIDRAVLQFDREALETPTSEGVRGFVDDQGDGHLIVPVEMTTIDEGKHKVFTNRLDYTLFIKSSAAVRSHPARSS